MKTTSFQKTPKMSGKPSVSYRSEVLAYAKKQYGTLPEYLWRSIPGYAVLRHTDSRKWYGLIMDVSMEKIGIHGKGTVDILEIKCDPILSASLLNDKGIRPAYHMKQGGWISALLEGSVEKDLLFSLLDMSYELTTKQKHPRSLPVRQNGLSLSIQNSSICKKHSRKARKSSGSRAAILLWGTLYISM